MTEDNFYKFVAIGWNGKSDIFKFLEDKYSIRIELDHSRKKLGIFYKYDNSEYVETLKKGTSIGEETILNMILKLFKTVDGIPEGPNPEFFIMNLEWT